MSKNPCIYGWSVFSFSFSYDCTGSITEDGHTIPCFDGEVHGEVDFTTAFAESCNTSFVRIGLDLGASAIQKTAEDLLFNKELPISLDYRKSTIDLKKSEGNPLKRQFAKALARKLEEKTTEKSELFLPLSYAVALPMLEKIDDTLPIVEGLSASTTWSKTNTITGIIKDNESGLEGYKITKEEIEPTEFIQIEGKEYNFAEEVTENGTYYIWVKDVKGNINKSSIEVSYVDNTPPILSSIQNSSNGSWAKEVTLSWEIEETGSGIAKVEWQLNDLGSWGKFDESEWYCITRRNIRNDKISIRITDKAGNVSNIESTMLKIDNTAPVLSDITNSSNGNWASKVTLKFQKKPVIVEAYQTDVEIIISTLEGDMKASPGDWIITGVDGEQYPCKPDIFERTYQRVN